jgi:hypothetical protein
MHRRKESNPLRAVLETAALPMSYTDILLIRPRKLHDRSQWELAPHDRYAISRLTVPSILPSDILVRIEGLEPPRRSNRF